MGGHPSGPRPADHDRALSNGVGLPVLFLIECMTAAATAAQESIAPASEFK